MSTEVREKRPNLLGLNQTELQAVVEAEGFPRYMTGQILTWLYEKKVSDFGLMSNISKENRAKLEAKFEVNTVEAVQKFPAADGTAIKYVFHFPLYFFCSLYTPY